MKIVAPKPVGGSIPSQETGDISEEANVIASNLSKALPEIDVIAPLDILKQILKRPYSKSRVSIAVYRFGQTLVLNPRPDFEEGKKLMRMDASDCPPEPIRKTSRLLLFSPETYATKSLRFRWWDVSQQVTNLTWLQAWLDNVMASVPQLAICNLKNGLVQGYELLPNGIYGGAPAVDPSNSQ